MGPSPAQTPEAVADLFKTTSLGLGSFAVMDTVSLESRHLSAHIDRPAQDVYDYASDPGHLPEWAPGLGSSIELIDDKWVMESPTGRIMVSFAARNEFGVLDHHVTLASGKTFYNPMRVIADRAGCEIVFTLRREVGVSDEDFERDANAVLSDLVRLKRKMERP